MKKSPENPYKFSELEQLCKSKSRYDTDRIGKTATTCRDDWIRTSDPVVPNDVRYRAALHPANNPISKEDIRLIIPLPFLPQAEYIPKLSPCENK